MDDLFSRAFRQEIDSILQSFLETKKDGSPPTIAKYDLPHIADLIARRIVYRMNAMKQPADTGSVT